MLFGSPLPYPAIEEDEERQPEYTREIPSQDIRQPVLILIETGKANRENNSTAKICDRSSTQ